MNLIKTNQLTMSSREIAELTGKQHKHVFRDIIKMLEDIGRSWEGLVQEWTHPQNKQSYQEFILGRKLTDCLLTGYSAKARFAVIERWHELEEKQSPALPDFSDPVAAARAWADEAEQKQIAQKQLAIAAPKVEFVDKYVQADGLKGFREVCKLLGVKEPVFRRFLEAEKIMYRLAGKLTAYAEHVQAGRFDTKTGEKGGHAFSQCKFTPKGVTWISAQWAKKESYYEEVERCASKILSIRTSKASFYSKVFQQVLRRSPQAMRFSFGAAARHLAKEKACLAK